MTSAPTPAEPQPAQPTPTRPPAAAMEPVEPDGRRMIALVVGIVATVAFAIVRFVVALSDQPPAIDVWWNDQMFDGRNDFWLIVAWIPGWAGGILGMIITAIIIVGIFLLLRRWWDAAHFAIALAVVVAIGAPMASLIARVRPESSLAEQVATSFPSGHTAVATTVAITLGLILRRWYVWVLGVVWVLWMMWSRTYLNAHWLTDVIAGMLEGVAVATLVWYAVEAVKDRRARKHRAAAASLSG